jgi:hypothetical protein
MSKLELGSLIHTALRHTIAEQEKLLHHEAASEFLPAARLLAKFIIELEDWYSGKFHLRENDRCARFLREAEKIEAETDNISEQVWKHLPISLVPHFRRLEQRRTEIQSDKSYPRQLRAQFNNFRIGLLEQVVGARFLENSNDLGEETERIFVQYLSRRLGSSVRILRGGHIYDYEGNRSGQIDIIIAPANALGFCPADTGDGKYNVMVDQVIAAISVTARLDVNGFKERVEQLQKIPQFKEKTQTYPGLKEQVWPLCYIVGAECEDLKALHKVWEEIGSPQKPPAMILLLDSGYIMQRALFPKGGGSDLPERIDQLWIGEGIYAGLGLGWLEIQISARNWWITGQKADWLNRLQKQLHDLEMTEPLLYDPQREPFLWAHQPIHGILRWGRSGMWVHNRLFVITLFVRKGERVSEATLLDRTKPSTRKGILKYEFEPRWFKQGVHAVNGDYCALEEWVEPRDGEKHQRRIAVFNASTGEDVTDELVAPLAECSEIARLHAVLRTG